MSWTLVSFIFFFNDTATTEIYTLSLHDAFRSRLKTETRGKERATVLTRLGDLAATELQDPERSEEHTSELQSQSNLVCRLLLEKKNKTIIRHLHRFYA